MSSLSWLLESLSSILLYSTIWSQPLHILLCFPDWGIQSSDVLFANSLELYKLRIPWLVPRLDVASKLINLWHFKIWIVNFRWIWVSYFRCICLTLTYTYYGFTLLLDNSLFWLLLNGTILGTSPTFEVLNWELSILVS